jgi:mono/diheme cytochrome c family protein
MSRSTISLLMAASWLIPGAGCVQEMADQPRVETMEESRFFRDGQGVRHQVPGTVARGQVWERTPFTTGRRGGELVETIPMEVDAKLLATGRKTFGIFCSHCHGPAGYGDGMVVQRGFAKPPSYHIERLRTAPDGHLFRVISDGFRLMPRFKERISPHDRWALIAYIRALQLSQNASPRELEERDKTRLDDSRE